MQISDLWKYKWCPSKAIRAKCVECSAGQVNEVRNCPVTSCPLWEYRFGKKRKSKFYQARSANTDNALDNSETEED